MADVSLPADASAQFTQLCLNWRIGGVAEPHLLKTLLGVDFVDPLVGDDILCRCVRNIVVGKLAQLRLEAGVAHNPWLLIDTDDLVMEMASIDARGSRELLSWSLLYHTLIIPITVDRSVLATRCGISVEALDVFVDDVAEQVWRNLLVEVVV
ncbi:MAG: hypothetical protein AAF125_06825 [Chloroflexota bacterium]